MVAKHGKPSCEEAATSYSSAHAQPPSNLTGSSGTDEDIEGLECTLSRHTSRWMTSDLAVKTKQEGEMVSQSIVKDGHQEVLSLYSPLILTFCG